MPGPRLPIAKRRARAARISAKYGPPPYSKGVSEGICREKVNLRRTPSGKLKKGSNKEEIERRRKAAAGRQAEIQREEEAVRRTRDIVSHPWYSSIADYEMAKQKLAEPRRQLQAARVEQGPVKPWKKFKRKRKR